jgi:hypothetical protein
VRRTDIEMGGAWAGLLLELAAGPVRAGLRMEVTSGRRMWLSQGDRAVLLARVNAARQYVDYLRVGGYESVLAPIRAADARVVAQVPAEAWAARWAYRFARYLDVPYGPLYRGRWLLAPAAEFLRPAHRAATVADRWRKLIVDEPSGTLDWIVHNGSGQVLCLRPLSGVDAGRVKAYRKQAREGILPPVLLWWVSGLDCYLLLDGHDRLVAALAENVEPLPITLTSIEGSSAPAQRITAALNRHSAATGHIEGEVLRGTPGAADALLAERQRFGDELARAQLGAARTRAWPIAGGVAAWRQSAAVADPDWGAADD